MQIKNLKLKTKIDKKNIALRDSKLQIIKQDASHPDVTVSMCCEIHGDSSKWNSPWTPRLDSINDKSKCIKCIGYYKYTREEYFILMSKEFALKGIRISKFIGDLNKKQTLATIYCETHGCSSEWDIPYISKLKDVKPCMKCSNKYNAYLSYSHVPSDDVITKINKKYIKSRNYNIKNLEIVSFKKDNNNTTVCMMRCSKHGNLFDWNVSVIPTYALASKCLIECSKCTEENGHYTEGECPSKTLVNVVNFNYKDKENIKCIGVLGDGINARNAKMHMVCTTHGDCSKWDKPWSPSYLNLSKKKSDCPKCLYEKLDIPPPSAVNHVSEGEIIDKHNKKLIKLKKPFKVYVIVGKYNGKTTRCGIICEIHGKSLEWDNPVSMQLTKVHTLKSCRKCSGRYECTEKEAIYEKNLLLKSTNISIIETIGEYVGIRSKVKVKCAIHGNCWEWGTPWVPSYELACHAKTCPRCSFERHGLLISFSNPQGFNMKRSLYFIKFKNLKNNEYFYKIGVCSGTIIKRFKKGTLKEDDIEIINIREYESNSIFSLLGEYWVQKKYIKDKKCMLKVLKNTNGGTECFSRDILGNIDLDEIIRDSISNLDEILSDFLLDDGEKYAITKEINEILTTNISYKHWGMEGFYIEHSNSELSVVDEIHAHNMEHMLSI